MRKLILPLSLVMVVAACQAPVAPQETPKEADRPTSTRAALFTSQYPRCSFMMRIAGVFQGDRRAVLPAELKSSDPDLPLTLSIAVRLPAAKERASLLKQEAKEVTIGRYLSGAWTEVASDHKSVASLECGVVGQKYRVTFSLQSPTIKSSELKQMLERMLESFDPTRRLGGTL